jgi:prepilin-type N-terminal cleavage/methylation domain-containing protein
MIGSGSREGGFTLVELLVAVLVGSLVIAGAIALLSSQHRLFQVTSADRAVQESGRMALEEMTTNLRLAGYGIDPAFAFDFGPLAAARQERAPQSSAVSAASTFSACTLLSCRDSTTGSDEVAFRYRNPAFVRSLASAPTGGNSITVAGPLNGALEQGQILQVMCFSGSMLWAYVTVGAPGAPATNSDTVTIPLASGNGGQFPFQNGYLADGCFGVVAPRNAPQATFAAAAKIYKVDQFRYYVQSYDAGGAIVANGTGGSRPYLMLDTGTVRSGNPVVRVVSPDVEDLQVAYLFPNSTGANIAAGSSGIDLSGSGPAFSDTGDSATRTTQHPGNIRAVVVSVLGRTTMPNSKVFDATMPAAGNRDVAAGPAGYIRQLFETTVATQNLDARGPHFPTYSATSSDRFSVGGG